MRSTHRRRRAATQTNTPRTALGRRRRGVAAAALTGLAVPAVLLGLPPADAAPSDLDLTFGNRGQVTVDAAGAGVAASGSDLALLPDGSVVAVGSLDSPDRAAYVAEIGPTGVVDPSFGVRRLDLAGSSEAAYAVAVQADGKIVVAGRTTKNQDGAVWRLLPSGEPDRTFSGDGLATLDSAGSEELYDVAIAPDGKIVAVGTTTAEGGQMAVYRLTTAGEPDQTFDTDGARGVGGAGADYGLAVAVQPDGKVLVTGSEAAAPDLTVHRLTATGQPDPAFDGDGAASVPGTDPYAYGLTLQPDGRILVGGQVLTAAQTYDIVVARLTPSGAVDATFGGPSGVRIDFGASEDVYALGVTPSGDVLGSGATDLDQDALLFQLRADGSPDTDFGPGGVRVVPGATRVVQGLVVQPDGRFLVIGDDGATAPHPVVFRFLGDPPSVGVGSSPTCHGRTATIVGTAGKDRLTGTSGADVVVALGGNDVVKGLGGNDVVCAGDGNDKVSGGSGKDLLYGESGKDRLVGGSGKDRLVGGPQRDEVRP